MSDNDDNYASDFADNDHPVLVAAVAGDWGKIKRHLDTIADPEIVKYGLGQALVVAADHGHANLVEKLLEGGADVNAAGWDNGGTALVWAAHGGNIGISKILITAGAEVNAADKYHGDTALLWASKYGHVIIAEMLLASGADVRLVNKDGRNALMLAAWGNELEITKRLLTAGAEVNAVNASENGNTALLYVAAGLGGVEVGKALMDAGADISIVGDDGATALECAKSSGNSDLVELLEQEPKRKEDSSKKGLSISGS